MRSVKILMQLLKESGIRVKLDDNDNSRPGWKFAEYELKGVPLCIAIGLNDIDNNSLEIRRRDLPRNDKKKLLKFLPNSYDFSVNLIEHVGLVNEELIHSIYEPIAIKFDALIKKILEDIQLNIYNKALDFQQSHITKTDSWEEFEKLLDEKGGFISAHWDGTPETEEAIKEKTKATIRCIPLNNPQEDGKCILTGKASKERVLFARAY